MVKKGERLHKYLARSGIASRRKCEEFIREGRVEVNGEVVREQGVKVFPGDDVLINGRPVEPGPLEYYLLNKPAGVISTVSDPRGRKTVVDLVPSRQRLFPVGRLDQDTTGLLILTNDGGLAHRLMHPRYEVDKVYRAEVRGKVSRQVLDHIREGVQLEEGPTTPAQAKLIAQKGADSLLEIVIHEGRKRQVRRMMEALGHPVIKLHRGEYAIFTDEDLELGQYRALTKREVAALEKLAREGRR